MEIAFCSLAMRVFGHRHKGKYVLAEGISMSGKTSMSDGLYHSGVLNTKPFLPVHEPGTTSLAMQVRNLVQGEQSRNKNTKDGLTPETSYSLYLAARASLWGTMILPGLQSGRSYFSDRSWPSSWAYQGAEGVPLWFIFLTSMHVTRWLVPNLILYVDVPVETAFERRAKKEDLDRYDVLDANFFKKVRSNYRALSKVFFGMGVWQEIDGTQSVKNVVMQATDAMRKRELIK